MADPLHHIARAHLPWRQGDPGMTECGRPIEELVNGRVWSLDEAQGFQSRMGSTRFAMVVCMTCLSRAGRWTTWAQSPGGMIQRALRTSSPAETARLTAELRAIALLIEAHRVEFDETVAGLLAVREIAQAHALRRGRGPTRRSTL